MCIDKSRGFTLIELMIVVSILAIFASIAVPSFNTLLENNRLASAANEFQALLNAARSDAVTRRTSIVVTQNDNVWSTADRQITIPTSIGVKADQKKITFNANGTATVSTTTLSSSKTNTSYTIETKLPGFVQKTQG